MEAENALEKFVTSVRMHGFTSKETVILTVEMNTTVLTGKLSHVLEIRGHRHMKCMTASKRI
jgi:hypothetical protein